MTIAKDILLAILSMDAYNRGYGSTVSDNGPGDTDGLSDAVGTRIGNAQVRSRSDSDPNSDEVNAGFYAIAYDMSGAAGFSAGDTVISYRGTDDLIEDLVPTDFPIIQGSYDEEHLKLAAAFYRSGSGLTSASPRSTSATI